MPAIAVREIIQDAYKNDKQMIAYAARDLKAIVQRDPAVDKYSIPLLYLKGFHALQAYRIGHWLWKVDRKTLAIYLQSQISVSLRLISILLLVLVTVLCLITQPVSLSVKQR